MQFPVLAAALLAEARRHSSRLIYRFRQGLQALGPRIDKRDTASAITLLFPGENEVFVSMEQRDQRHGLEVLRRLQDRGVVDRDLLVAALLHDCGKGAIPVWLRSLNVLAPALVRRLACNACIPSLPVLSRKATRLGESRTEGSKGGVRSAAHRLCHHPALGAALAARAGSTAATVRYIGGRVRPEEKAKMELLMAADDES